MFPSMACLAISTAVAATNGRVVEAGLRHRLPPLIIWERFPSGHRQQQTSSTPSRRPACFQRLLGTQKPWKSFSPRNDVDLGVGSQKGLPSPLGRPQLPHRPQPWPTTSKLARPSFAELAFKQGRRARRGGAPGRLHCPYPQTEERSSAPCPWSDRQSTGQRAGRSGHSTILDQRDEIKPWKSSVESMTKNLDAGSRRGIGRRERDPGLSARIDDQRLDALGKPCPRHRQSAC